VNLRDLAQFPAGSEVTPESLRETRIVRSLRRPIKILGDGEVSAAITVRAHRVSSAARAKIESAGGTVEELTPRPAQPEKKRKSARAEEAKKEETPQAESEAAPTPESDQEERDDSGSETG
jgi:hypothetical protein